MLLSMKFCGLELTGLFQFCKKTRIVLLGDVLFVLNNMVCYKYVMVDMNLFMRRLKTLIAEVLENCIN